MITLLIVAAIWMNEYLDNLCHMNRTTGTTYAFFLFLKCLLASLLTLFTSFTFLRLGSCIHCILACFLWSKKPTHSLSNCDLCRCNSCRHKLFLAKVLIFSLMFSQALFTSSSTCKFSKAANLFVISLLLLLLFTNMLDSLKM